MINGISPTATALIIVLGTATGFGLGKVDIDAVVDITRESYINRYLTMSGSNRKHITYFVYTRQADDLPTVVESIPGVVAVKKAKVDHLFDVVIDYPKRREVVKALEQIPQVATVFTVPLMCH